MRRSPSLSTPAPAPRRSVFLLLLSVTLAACSQAPQTPQAVQDSGQEATLVALALPGTAASTALSSLPWVSASNGYGPVEKNMSNGEQNAGDGRALKIGTRAYSSGLGVHAPSDLSYALDGRCQRLTAEVGIDAETQGKGRAAFQVWADGQKLYDSGLLTGQSPAIPVSVLLTGRKTLRLVVQGAAGQGGNDYAHADWGDVHLMPCTSGTPGPVTPPGPVADVNVFSGPLVITRGGTYSGNWESKDPAVPAVEVRTSEPVVIQNSRIKGVGHYGLIEGWHVRLSVKNTTFTGLRPAGVGKSVPHALNLGEVYNLDLQRNLFDHTAGVYVNTFQGDSAKGETIKVLYNKNTNSDGRLSDGAGGFLKTDRKIVNFVMFNHVQAPGAEIAWNEDINTAYQSLVEDNINMYVSGGSLARPILIHDNYVQGAYGIDPVNDKAFYGGGILIGDGPTERAEQSGHIRVYKNQVVGTANYGLGIVGGSDQQVYDNRVVSSGLLPDGRMLGYTNVGLMLWNYYKSTPDLFFGNTIRDNVSTFTHRKADGSVDGNNVAWLPDCMPGGCKNNTTTGSATLQDEQNEFTAWKAKLSAASLKVGPLN